MNDSQLRYRAIIFDMGDVFFDATIWRKWLAEHLRSLGVAIDYARLCRAWDAKLVDAYLGRRRYWDVFEDFLSELELDDEAIEGTLAAGRDKAAEVERRVLFEGVGTTLSRLKAMGVRLAVLSDSESHEARLRQRLADLGIEQHFDAILTSVDIGHVKPQPEAFEAALSSLQACRETTLFVGHDEEELRGAMGYGLATAAYNFQGSVPARFRIGRFSELIGLVRRRD